MEPPAWVTDEDAWRASCHRLAAEAQGLLGGSVSVLEAARRIEDASGFLCSPYQRAYGLAPDCDVDFTTFHQICNESIHLPVGTARQHWSPDALARVDAELKRLEEKWRERALSAANDLVQKYAVV